MAVSWLHFLSCLRSRPFLETVVGYSFEREEEEEEEGPTGKRSFVGYDCDTKNNGLKF